MKRTSTLLCRVAALTVMLVTATASAWAINTKESTEQVTTLVTLDTDVDYSITGSTPFGDGGIVNIANTDHAVLILQAVKPSAALKLLADHVQINGAKAVNNTNCQVKLYNLGCIILPYGNSVKPLTVYSEQNFQGTAVNDFGLENDGGYMNTLTDKKLNNRIRSFKLKRGYMVTFSNRASGRGYSRCFIAADQDLEMATLPGVLDRSISSYRVFKWYDAGKKNLANSAGDTGALSALNVQSTYDWGQGNGSLAPDIEWVPNHIYEDWPSSSTIGKTTQSPHTKTNNEPRNSSDDHPQDLKTILGNWENMMRTGLRLCSPASWDGSDYWNATGFLAEFLDSIDARGWRCDIIDLHCYWAESNFGNIANWANKYKRPVWISEWCWGASWNSNGAFASGVTEAQVKDALERICTKLNGWDYVERYFYWNGERDPSRLYKNGSLTAAGRYYASMNSGVGYKGRSNYVPSIPQQGDPGTLSVSYDKTTNTATLSWWEPNGELNSGMYVERQQPGSSVWESIADLQLQEEAAQYEYRDSTAVGGCQYRIHVVDANNKDHYTKAVMAASDNVAVGDVVPVDGKNMYMGGNIFVNGSFDMDTYGWLDGTGNALDRTMFQVVPVGGNDGGTYLQVYGNGSQKSNGAIYTPFDVVPNSYYYFSGATCNNTGSQQQLKLGNDASTLITTPAFLYNTTEKWSTKFTVFNTDIYSVAVVTFRLLGAKSQFDQLVLCQLFDTKEEAYANGVVQAKKQAQAFTAFNTKYDFLNTDLNSRIQAVSGEIEADYNECQQAVDNALAAYHTMSKLDSLLTVADRVSTFAMPGIDRLTAASEQAKSVATAADVLAAESELREALNDYMPLTAMDTNPVKQPSFASTTGWTVKCGTYTGGDQRTNTQNGVTFWNAWWSGLSASEGTDKTMAIKQDVSGLGHGLYAVRCKATTEHYCLSDQHAYITDGTVTAETPVLTADYYDLPTMTTEQRWQTLTSTPIYVEEGGSVTIGFVGSKQGAVDNLWHKIGDATSNGDKREGWWCATDFELVFCPMYKATVEADQWGVICLPYAVRATDDLHIYEIAAVSRDYTKICLREISESSAGMAFIYKSSKADVTFFEFGAAAKSTKDGPGNLRGFLKTSAKAPTGSYVLQDGVWNKVGTDRPQMTNYTGIIRAFTDAMSKQVPVVDEWDGPTMPINGVTEEEMAAAIKLPTAVTLRSNGFYTIDGRYIGNDSKLKPGLYIRVEDGKAYKTIMK